MAKLSIEVEADTNLEAAVLLLQAAKAIHHLSSWAEELYGERAEEALGVHFKSVADLHSLLPAPGGKITFTPAPPLK